MIALGWEPTLRTGSSAASQCVAAHGNDLLLRQCSSPASGGSSLESLCQTVFGDWCFAVSRGELQGHHRPEG